MKKLILAIGLIALPLLGGPVAAQTTPPAAQAMTCSAEMKKADDMMSRTSDTKKKEMAMKEMGMAKDMMAKKDEKGCMTHTGAAMKALN